MDLIDLMASDFEDHIKNAELLGKKKRKREVANWLAGVELIRSELRELHSEVQTQGFAQIFLGGDRAKKLNERLDTHVQQCIHFGELVLDVYQTKEAPFAETKLVGHTYGDILSKILKLLVEDRVASVGIYGMGGVGKTALMKHIHNRLLERSGQECVIWVTVSRKFSIRTLQNEFDEDKRVARLKLALSQKTTNIVLILDDVWEFISMEKIGDLSRLLGCRVVITTRSMKICHEMDCQQVIGVKPLDMDEACELFTQVLGRKTKLDPKVEEIANSMVKLCDGLPLGVIALAKSMRGENAIHAWRNALAKLEKCVIMGLDEILGDEVFKVLGYSFDALDPKRQMRGTSNGHTPLQRCFLYCSLYPKGHRIEREELVRKFISEDLVDKTKCTTEQIDEAHSILDKLVNVCLLEETDGEDCVKMHNLVRGMTLKITQGENAGNPAFKEIPEFPSPICPKLSSTLLRNGNPLKFIQDASFPLMRFLVYALIFCTILGHVGTLQKDA
ncbi:hypothetical protein MIMGU_mgv1a021731mg [Erythranthe guttata]|uniref:AAA+ ATPase domain-containing protein n=1 Tax=Erythranthe guttata TaxID=4155 RepID=A0A022Q7J7_ERYGU|nr:hypothetical protein MIMGU_mgv1a021731mg [Erythranthe guttata]